MGGSEESQRGILLLQGCQQIRSRSLEDIVLRSLWRILKQKSEIQPVDKRHNGKSQEEFLYCQNLADGFDDAGW